MKLPINKWRSELNRHFFQKVNKQTKTNGQELFLKVFSIPWHQGECKLKALWNMSSFQLSSRNLTVNVGEDVERKREGEPLITVVEVQINTVIVEISLDIS